VAHLLDPIAVFDPDGRETRLGQLWAERTAVLVFLRHFGCLFCRQQVDELRQLRAPLQSLGAEVILIGQGTVEQAREFRDEAHPFRVFTDPTRQAYCAMQMRQGRRSVLTMGVLRHGLNAWRLGFRQSRVAGDPFQQGGVVIIAPTGLERYRFISREAGDHPRPVEILAALKKK